MIIRSRSGHRWHRLDYVQPVHFIVWTGQIAPPVKIFHVANVSRPAGHEIRIQRNNHVRFFQPVNRIYHATECQLCAFYGSVTDSRLPLVPLRLRERSEQPLDLVVQ